MGEICDLRKHPWHKERSSEWLRESGGRLTREERLNKNEFQKIFSHVNYDEVEAYAITMNTALSEKILKQQLGNAKARELSHVLQAFAPRFQKLWNKRKPRLQRLQALLKKDDPAFADALNDLTTLSAMTKNEQRTFSLPAIHLMMSSEQERDTLGWFSSINKDTHLVLESSQKPDSKQAVFLQLILLHELFHAMVRTSRSTRNIINTFAEQFKKILQPYAIDMTPKLFLEEMLISSFVPEGYLAHKHFNTPILIMPRSLSSKEARNITKTRLYCAYHMREYTKKYILDNLGIDELAFKLIIISIINFI